MRISRRARRARFYTRSDDTIEGILIARRAGHYLLEAAEAVTGPNQRTSLNGLVKIPAANVRFYTEERDA